MTQKNELVYSTRIHRTTLGQLKTPYDTFYTVRTAIPLMTQKNELFYSTGIPQNYLRTA